MPLAALRLLPLLLVAACAAAPPRINEFMADNASIVANNDGDYADWIEICNPASEPLSLGGYYLTDDLADPTRHPLPAAWEVPAGGRLVLWATGTADDASFSLPFKLSADGEAIGLFTEEDGGASIVPIDQVEFDALSPDTSLARSPDCEGAWTTPAAPTPGAANP